MRLAPKGYSLRACRLGRRLSQTLRPTPGFTRFSEKYADPRQPGSYVELVRRRTRTKVHTSKLLARVDQELKDLREKHECLWGQYNLNRKLYKHFDKTKDEKLEEFAKEKAKLTEALDSEQAQNRILSEELVRQTRSHEGRDGEASHPLSQGLRPLGSGGAGETHTA
ncbi:hypothetical protein AXG93_3875s1000 [Marchantia polymorpha subsp. ruderalis]|uniref:Uncharacterized protein n=1 Tax=Marchantia polymorpha subsp. ruderalis TaxID=1480154 RepID=A0A176WJP5_MARPO|nr:hypothetical protein AXG93_3875s1000 [Marchantia polymorpha subsp. ruderalis]